IGIVLGAVGSLVLAYLLCLKLLLGQDIGTRPMLFTGFFLLIAGVQMVTSGVLAELLARVYHEANGVSAYVARPRPDESDSDGWYRLAS
ncbi:MAG: glycosyltransferase, partial [Mesorhizobium sp.]